MSVLAFSRCSDIALTADCGAATSQERTHTTGGGQDARGSPSLSLSFPAHRIVLACTSDYFAALFRTNMSDR